MDSFVVDRRGEYSSGSAILLIVLAETLHSSQFDYNSDGLSISNPNKGSQQTTTALSLHPL